MGTRAQFFVGHPSDLKNRAWLGTIAFDGYPDGDCGVLVDATSEDEFRAAVVKLASERDDFCDPAKRSFPFPWKNDLYLTDCTYAWFDDAVQYTSYDRGFIPLATFLNDETAREAYYEQAAALPGDVMAPSDADGKPAGPDSIMILRVG